jgi:hypothetical protein
MRRSFSVRSDNVAKRERLLWTTSWVAAFTASGLLYFTHYYLDLLARGGTEDPRVKLIEEMTAAYGSAVCFLPAVWASRRAYAGR